MAQRPKRATPTTRPRGPRGDAEHSRAIILAAAEHEFGTAGFQNTSVRAIAARAGVNAKLVHYYFGTKLELFTAALDRAIERLGVLRLFTEAPQTSSTTGTGQRYLEIILNALDTPTIGPGYISLIRNLGTDQQTRDYFRSFITEHIIANLCAHLPGEHGHIRVGLTGSHIVGILMARYIVEIEPLRSLPPTQIAQLVGPTLDRYLYGDLPGITDATVPLPQPSHRPNEASA